MIELYQALRELCRDYLSDVIGFVLVALLVIYFLA